MKNAYDILYVLGKGGMLSDFIQKIVFIDGRKRNNERKIKK